jgi:hypothetical protein
LAFPRIVPSDARFDHGNVRVVDPARAFLNTLLGTATTTVSGAAAAGVYGVGTSAISSSGVPKVPAVQVGTGHAYFNGGNPSSSQAFKNALTPKNIIKASAQVEVDGPCNVVLNDGFNIGSVTGSCGVYTITFGSGFSSANYAFSLQKESGVESFSSKTATTLVINAGNVQPGCSCTPTVFDMIVVGPQ